MYVCITVALWWDPAWPKRYCCLVLNTATLKLATDAAARASEMALQKVELDDTGLGATTHAAALQAANSSVQSLLELHRALEQEHFLSTLGM